MRCSVASERRRLPPDAGRDAEAASAHLPDGTLHAVPVESDTTLCGKGAWALWTCPDMDFEAIKSDPATCVDCRLSHSIPRQL